MDLLFRKHTTHRADAIFLRCFIIKLLHERTLKPVFRIYVLRYEIRRLSLLRTDNLFIGRFNGKTGSGSTTMRCCTLIRHRSRWTNSWAGSQDVLRLQNYSTWRNRRRNARRTSGSTGSRSREYEHDSRPEYVQR